MKNTGGNFSRRSMLQLGAAGMAGLALGGLSHRAFAADAKDDYAGLPLGLQSYSLRSMPYKNALEAMNKDLGLRYIEIYRNHVGWTANPEIVTINNIAGKPDDALALAKENNIAITSVGAVAVTAQEPATRNVFAFAKRMGLKNITISPDANAFDLLDKLVVEFGVTLSIHDHGPGDKWEKIATIEKAIKDHNPKIGLCNDTGHFIRAGEDPMDACKRLGARMYAMHLKDFKKDAKGAWVDCVLGDGSLDVDAIIKYLIDNKFTGALSIEYEGKDEVASIQKSLDRIKAAVKKATA